MIYLYSGTPGSGKSLDMARAILGDLKNNKPVICNFDIFLVGKNKRYEKNYHMVNNADLSPQFLYNFSKTYFKTHRFGEDKINLYIDECQLLFNARQWNAVGRDDWLKFFTNHRHYGYCIVLACQFDRMIDRQIRCLIETEVLHRKCNNMGWMGAFFRILFLSPTLFVKVHYYYPTKLKLRSEFFRYHRKYAAIYNSYSTVFVDGDTGDSIPQTQCHKRRKLLDRCALALGICVCALVQYLGNVGAQERNEVKLFDLALPGTK